MLVFHSLDITSRIWSYALGLLELQIVALYSEDLEGLQYFEDLVGTFITLRTWRSFNTLRT